MNERFWSKVDKRGPDECWLWTAHTNRDGYGRVGFDRKVMYAHRLSFEMANGPIPDGMHVLHRCDNPGCVNPSHLFFGTHLDNMRDMLAKGRRWLPKGESHGGAKLTGKDVIAIRVDPRSHRRIAADYKVTHSAVGLIKRRVNWRHIAN